MATFKGMQEMVDPAVVAEARGKDVADLLPPWRKAALESLAAPEQDVLAEVSNG